MLTNQTTGYPDYETDPAWLAAFNDDPFHMFTYEERIKYAFDTAAAVRAGHELELRPHQLHDPRPHPREDRRQAARPAARGPGARADGPARTRSATTTSAIPEPALHTFSSERRAGINIPNGRPVLRGVDLLEHRSGARRWAPTRPRRSTTSSRAAIKIGTGELLSEESFHEMTDSKLIGFGKKEPACEPSCFTQIDAVQLRPRRGPLGRLDPAEPAAQRHRRDHGLPPGGGHRHRRRGDARPGRRSAPTWATTRTAPTTCSARSVPSSPLTTPRRRCLRYKG